MSNYLKPQSPLQIGSDFVYPLTTADQVILNDGTRWDGIAGSDIQIEPAITSGTKLATITVDGTSKDLYYQASAVTLNGTATTSASFYAPTSAGTAGQVLKSNGSGAPGWVTLGSNAYTSTAYLPLTGGTLTGDINIQGANYPSFCLQPTTANSAGTYTGGFFEGSYYDNVSMWVWTDRTNHTKSRRGLVLKGYAGCADDNYALVLRKCDTSGNWKNDSYILTSDNYSSYALPLAGGTMTGDIHMGQRSIYWKENSYGDRFAISTAFGGTDDANLFRIMGAVGAINANPDLYDLVTISGKSGNVNVKGTVSAAAVYGAVWNDYAEYRSQNETIEPGYITYCDDDGKLKKTVERLQKYEGIVSDTFGFAIGETDDCKTPLAVSGRALVYCDPEEEHFHAGDCVCAGPDGLAYRMTREEVMEFPDRIVGVVSEIPTYKTWGTGNVEVNGRIWVKVK